QGHGFLSLADQNEAYGIPIVYGYDPEEELFTTELLFEEPSRKGEFLSASEEVTLCVYEWEDLTEWRSVIASGELERVEDRGRISDLMALLAENPADVVPWSYRSPLSDLDDRVWYVLHPDSLTGFSAE
ncbi:MAG: pyridoxamine 5'-phosphate oxidase family protein, partial [Halovenus sp.]